MIPAVAGAGLAEWCDVFCETECSHRPNRHDSWRPDSGPASNRGSTPTSSAPSGGSLVAAAVGARSADHLVYASTRRRWPHWPVPDVIATLLPNAAFYLKLGRFAPAREFVAASIPVALATDVNPGGGFSPSMPFAMTLACFAMATDVRGGARRRHHQRARGRSIAADTVGSLEPGKQMDAVIVDGDAIDLIRVGANSIRAVVKAGRIVHEPVTAPVH